MYASEDEGSGFFSPVAHRDPNMSHSSAADLLKVLLGHKGVPVGAQSLFGGWKLTPSPTNHAN